MKALPPDRIRSLPIWVAWKYENGTKVPYNVSTGYKAKSNDPATWATYDEAYRAAITPGNGYAGIGSMFPDGGNITGVDFDDCFTEDGDMIPDVATEVARLNSYTEISPSGQGVKVWVEATSPTNIGNTAFVDGSSIEIYSRVRFFTFTGNHLPGTPLDIHPAQAAVEELAERVRPQPIPVKRTATIPMVTHDAQHVRRYCLAALDGERAKIEAAGDGGRHWQRWCSGKACGGLIHTGGLTEDEILAALDVNHGKNAHVAHKTLRDAIAAGIDLPRDIPAPLQPTYDADGHACCPTHGERLIASRNGNGWRCPAPKLGDPLCFWWQGDGYTPPADVSAQDVADLDSLDPDELRRRYLVVVAERDRWKQRAQQLELQLGDVQTRNRFVSKATSAEGIGAASKRLSFIELTKELERVPLEDRVEGQYVRVRPGYMAKCTGQDKGTISRHLGEFASAGLIEKKVERTFDPETQSWCSETFVRPLVDLSDPSQVNVPSKPRGRHACRRCGSDKLVRETKIYCAECETIYSHTVDLVNTPEPELQFAIQDEPAQEAATFFDQQPVESLNCNAPHREKTDVLSPELQTATQTTAPSVPSTPFLLTPDLQEIPDGVVLPSGAFSTMNLSTMKTVARLPDVPPAILQEPNFTAAIQAADQLKIWSSADKLAYQTALNWLHQQEPDKAQACLVTIQSAEPQAVLFHLIGRLRSSARAVSV